LAEKLGVPTLLISGHPDQISRQRLSGVVQFLATEAAVRDLLGPTRNGGRNAPNQLPADVRQTIGTALAARLFAVEAEGYP
jgi:hypothetical protein